VFADRAHRGTEFVRDVLAGRPPGNLVVPFRDRHFEHLELAIGQQRRHVDPVEVAAAVRVQFDLEVARPIPCRLLNVLELPGEIHVEGPVVAHLQGRIDDEVVRLDHASQCSDERVLGVADVHAEPVVLDLEDVEREHARFRPEDAFHGGFLAVHAVKQDGGSVGQQVEAQDGTPLHVRVFGNRFVDGAVRAIFGPDADAELLHWTRVRARELSYWPSVRYGSQTRAGAFVLGSWVQK